MPLKDKEKRKEYQKQYVKNHYSKNKDIYKARSKESNRKVKKRNKEYVRDYLLNHCCVDCGETNIIVLDFDHVRGKKEFNVGDLIRQSFSLKRIIEEINKCEVRCANCHRIATHMRRIKKLQP